MNKITVDDIANVYFQHELTFTGLVENDTENLLQLEHVDKNVKLISKQELINDFDVSPDVANKIIEYQMDLISNYRSVVTDLLGRIDRYEKIKPYLSNAGLDKIVLTQYVMGDWDQNKNNKQKEFHPIKHLRSGLVGVLLSYVVFMLLVGIGWKIHAPVGVDFICLGLVAFIWLGFTTAFARQLPREYRARKIVWHILDMR